MSLSCFKCPKNTESKNPKVAKIKNVKSMLLSKCEVCHSKKPKLIKDQETSRLLNSLEIKIPLSKISFVGFLFCLRVSNKLIKFIRWMKKSTNFY